MRRYAPDVYGLPGAASFKANSWGAKIKSQLAQLYRGNDYPVVFIDESFALEGGDTFYIIGAAVVVPDSLNQTRKTLLEFYGGDALHAGPMYSRGEKESLRQATALVAHNHDGLDIVVCSPIETMDTHADRARAQCLRYIVPKLHREFKTQLFVIDARKTPTQNTLDKRTFSDLRKENLINRDTALFHCRPSEEALLGLPDVLAWSYRQEHIRRDTSWFDPLRSTTQVHHLA